MVSSKFKQNYVFIQSNTKLLYVCSMIYECGSGFLLVVANCQKETFEASKWHVRNEGLLFLVAWMR